MTAEGHFKKGPGTLIHNLTTSDIRIDKEGIWYYRGREIYRIEIVRLFYQNLKRDEAGRYLIELENDRCYLEVEDTPFVVRAVYRCTSKPDNEDCIYLLLSDQSLEKLDADTLRVGKDNVLYCSVKNGVFITRFSRAAYYQIADFIEHDNAADRYFIPLNGKQFCINITP